MKKKNATIVVVIVFIFFFFWCGYCGISRPDVCANSGSSAFTVAAAAAAVVASLFFFWFFFGQNVFVLVDDSFISLCRFWPKNKKKKQKILLGFLKVHFENVWVLVVVVVAVMVIGLCRNSYYCCCSVSFIFLKLNLFPFQHYF